ncbi:MAG: CGNR zinc finger domain-containing protein [Ilumatobacteraceae bacterium]
MGISQAAVSASGRPFEFVANHIVLDFINTVNARPIFSRDDLTCTADVLYWAHAAGVLLDHDRGARDPRNDAAVTPEFEAVVDLRERLYRVFGPIAAGHEPSGAALSALARRGADAIRSAKWHRVDSGYEPRWTGVPLESVADRIADEAIRLLRSSAIERIGACHGCGWLFLDVSRAHARRWCSMNVCGVRHKMRRYHQRQSKTVDAT